MEFRVKELVWLEVVNRSETFDQHHFNQVLIFCSHQFYPLTTLPGIKT